MNSLNRICVYTIFCSKPVILKIRYLSLKHFLKRADLIRFDNDRITQSIIPFNLGNVLSDESNKQNIILLPGDEIRVFSETVFNTVPSVSINGVVRRPGTYNLKRYMNLTDLILEAGD